MGLYPSSGGSANAVILAPDTSARNVIQPTGAAVVPLVTKGFAGQTANLQEWQNSAGGVVQAIRADGYFANNINMVSGNFYTQYGAASFGALQPWAHNFSGSGVGLNGNTPVAKAAAIAAPTAPGAVYQQTEAQSAVAAINAIRAALTNIGITA